MPSYVDIADAVADVGMIARGGFVLAEDERAAAPTVPSGRAAHTIVMIGNAGPAMWPHFVDADVPGPNPLDTWTRSVLGPIAARFGAGYVHPSDRPYQPFQCWAQRADAVWSSPIGLLVHGEYGLWHAYRGAFLFDHPLEDLPAPPAGVSPCVTCVDQPCLATCPVDAFTADGYDAMACRHHVASEAKPDCLNDGCAARRACPVAPGLAYGRAQMRLHMGAFVGLDA